MLEIVNLYKRFGRFEALKGISLNVAPAQTAVLMGPNASGKSTLIKTILGITPPTQGDIRLEGRSILGIHDYRDRIGYMPQLTRLPDNLSIGGLFDMMTGIRAQLAQRLGSRQLDWELYNAYALDAMRGKKLGTLSGGTRQKVSAALALLFRPDIIILDEPSTGLDPLATEVLKDKVRQVRAEGRLTLLTSHIFAEAEELGDRLLYLRDGRIHIDEPLSAIRAEAATLAEAVRRRMDASEPVRA